MVSLTGLTTYTSNFFSRLTEKDLTKGVGIVALTGVLMGATSYIVTGRIQLPAEAASMGDAIKIIGAVSGFATVLIGFAFWTGVYHGVSHLLGGEGNLKRMFVLNGFANLPFLGQQILRFAYYFLVNDTGSTFGGSVIQAALSVLNVWALLNIALTVYALRENYKLKGWKLVLLAVLPLLVGLALTLAMRPLAASRTSALTG